MTEMVALTRSSVGAVCEFGTLAVEVHRSIRRREGGPDLVDLKTDVHVRFTIRSYVQTRIPQNESESPGRRISGIVPGRSSG